VASPIVEGFSLSHAEILDGVKTFAVAAAAYASGDAFDIYGVNQASLDPDTDDFQNEGDDVIMSDWSWLNWADLEVQAGYLSFPLIGTLTGQTVSSAGAGDSQTFGLDLWHEDSMNVAPKPMIIVMPSKTKDGLVRKLVIGLYKVQFAPITFDGPEYKEGLKVNYNGKALMADKDEVGVAFVDGKKKVGRLLSVL
jgi:hypothetical protein